MDVKDITDLIYENERDRRVLSALYNGDHTIDTLSTKTDYCPRYVRDAVKWLMGLDKKTKEQKKERHFIYKSYDNMGKTIYKVAVTLDKVTRDYHNGKDFVVYSCLPTYCKYCKTKTGEPQTRKSCEDFGKGCTNEIKIDFDVASNKIKKLLI